MYIVQQVLHIKRSTPDFEVTKSSDKKLKRRRFVIMNHRTTNAYDHSSHQQLHKMKKASRIHYHKYQETATTATLSIAWH